MTSAARTTLAAVSGPYVRVSSPAGRAFFHAAGATSALAAAQRRQTRHKHRRSPAGTARATAPTRSRGRSA